MATKLICDGCGHVIPKCDPRDPSTGDGLKREAALILGTSRVGWDLCDPCLGNAAEALAKALPFSRRVEWIHVVRPDKGNPKADPAA